MSTPPDRIPRHLLMPSVYEAEAAADLLGCGIDLLRGEDIHAASMFATLATGAEKMLKLGIGLLSVDETGEWPSVEVMSRDLRHEIGLMHGRTLNDMRRRLDAPETAGTAPGHVRGLLQEVHDDMRLHLIVICLSDYAKGGRFHNLDTLAGSEPPRPSPREMWNALELRVLESDPELWATLGTQEYGAVGDPGMRRLMASSVARWWNLHHRAWLTGVFGRRAQLMSVQLGHKLPRDLL